MTRFSFSNCRDCGRLNIHGARCVCDPLAEVDCDCEGGNTQRLGPKCAQRARDVWAETLLVSHELAREIGDQS